MRADLNLDLCLVKNDCIHRLNVKRNGLFYCSGLLLASLSTASNYSVKNSRLKAVYRCDSTADEAELSLVSGPRRQKLLPSADRDILRASEYICNLKSAGTKSLSPLVVDFRWADEPQIWGPPTRRESSPASAGSLIKIYDAVEQTVPRGRRQNTWRQEKTWESVNPRQPDLHYCMASFYCDVKMSCDKV